MPRLTPREREILEQYIDLGTGAKVAEVLGITPQTVKNHLYQCRKRNGAKNTTQLVYMLATGMFDDV